MEKNALKFIIYFFVSKKCLRILFIIFASPLFQWQASQDQLMQSRAIMI